MSKATCSADSCERPAHARGMCPGHYMRWWKANPQEPKKRYPSGVKKTTPSISARFWRKVDVSDVAGCWPWTGARTLDGYGMLGIEGRTTTAHRVSYSLFIGPVDAALQVDHLCRNRACVNPSHLEQVTQQENTRRRDQARQDH